ncbi:MAG: hypothetical protein PVJ02_01460 [Gemmatimonadota bacterium]|jgi:hypothetical protein
MDDPVTDLAALPLRHSAPVRIRGVRAAPDAVQGAMTLLRLPDRRVGVTCQHVVAAFREERRRDPTCAFLVGGAALVPDDRILDEARFLDLAVLDLDDVRLSGLSDPGAAPVAFFDPAAWPLGSAAAGETLGLGRGGAEPRAAGPPDTTGGAAAGSWVARVLDAGAENIVCEVPAAGLGGLSGGPGFVRRDGVDHLAGVVFAVARSGAYLRLRPARFIRRDGTLLPRGVG